MLLRYISYPPGNDGKIVLQLPLFAFWVLTRSDGTPCMNDIWSYDMQLDVTFYRMPFKLEITFHTWNDCWDLGTGDTYSREDLQRECCIRGTYRDGPVPIPT